MFIFSKWCLSLPSIQFVKTPKLQLFPLSFVNQIVPKPFFSSFYRIGHFPEDKCLFISLHVSMYRMFTADTKRFPKACMNWWKTGAQVHPQSDEGVYERWGLGGFGIAADVWHLWVVVGGCGLSCHCSISHHHWNDWWEKKACGGGR